MKIFAQEAIIYYNIIIDEHKERVFLVPYKDKWSLPYWETKQPPYWQDVASVNQMMKHKFAMNVTTLRCVTITYNSETRCQQRFYELENHDLISKPALGRWTKRQDLSAFIIPEQYDMVMKSFRDMYTMSVQRKPWTRKGWFDTAVSWIDKQAVHLGFQVIQPVEQMRIWERGCVMKIHTSLGILYFKALPPMFAHEIPLTIAMSKLHSQHFVELLAIEHEQNWMLMIDIGNRSLHTFSELELWKDTLRTYARLQIASVAYTDELVSLGCHNRCSEKIHAEVDSFLASLSTTYPHISDTVVEHVKGLSHQLKTECDLLSHCRIPSNN
ncbi:hypothetical protein ccbrp13_06900 [Ktedonobacteria bacterium brp13]|nr:hypothetical protein ccbrp13_06900 [Ktedonobacteria bacterium brp13]